MNKSNEIIEAMGGKRKDILNAMSLVHPAVGDLLLSKSIQDYILSCSKLGQLNNEIATKLKTYEVENNSFQWKCNINNIDLPDNLQEFNNVESHKQILSTLFKQGNKLDYQKTLKRINIDYKQSKDQMEIDQSEDQSPQGGISQNITNPLDVFKTAGDVLDMEEMKKLGNMYNVMSRKKVVVQRHKSNKFIPPLLSNESENSTRNLEEPEDERLKNIDPKIIELIRSEIMDAGSTVEWNDIAGLQFAKTSIKEAVVWPMLRPDIFTGLRRPPKGILLFGPPGTGKTLIGKCVASQSKSTFFSISASSLTSKWVGEGEKMVRALFTIARCHQPAVIFIDEIDSLLSQRSESEHECSRRIKTEFLVQLDGARTESEERLLIIGATNRPQELDEAARRRFVKRLYIPLPENEGRLQLVKKLMEKEKNCLSDEDYIELAKLSDGYSGADIKTLCSDACLGPIRTMDFSQIENLQLSEVRPVSMFDFTNALARVRSSVSPSDLEQYLKWDKTYGSASGF